MYIVDDPTLALIARFVGDSARQDVSDAEFFRRQYAAIEEYVERFPPEQRDQRALAWIEANAMRVADRIVALGKQHGLFKR